MEERRVQDEIPSVHFLKAHENPIQAEKIVFLNVTTKTDSSLWQILMQLWVERDLDSHVWVVQEARLKGNVHFAIFHLFMFYDRLCFDGHWFTSCKPEFGVLTSRRSWLMSNIVKEVCYSEINIWFGWLEMHDIDHLLTIFWCDLQVCTYGFHKAELRNLS